MSVLSSFEVDDHLVRLISTQSLESPMTLCHTYTANSKKSEVLNNNIVVIVLSLPFNLVLLVERMLCLLFWIL